MSFQKLLLLILLFFTLSATAQNLNQVYIHPFSNSIGIGLEGGITYSTTDYNSNSYDYLGRGLIEYFFNSNSIGTFGLRVHAGMSYIGGEGGVKLSNSQYSILNTLKTSVYHIGGGYSYTISLGEVVHPYVFAGLAYIQFYPRGDNNIRIASVSGQTLSQEDINYDGELGIRFLLRDNFSLNFVAAIHFNPNDNLDGIWGNDNDDIFYSANIGMSYYLNDGRDSDGDGVDDSEDFCPNTPPHLNVDNFGCPIDTDNDGVPDQIDLCSETPAGFIVDTNGCPIDLDEDGIVDNLDQCLYTPTGVEVDSVGCPSDMDKDGIPNYLDQCPQTPPGCLVSKNGCPDIIFDSTYNKIVLNNFNFGRKSLPDGAEKILDLLIDYINIHPQFKWSIEGHSDSIATDCENNFKLSVDRAESVFNYLIENGIDKNKLLFFGFSHFRPIAENTSEKGRGLNRRVEIIKQN